MPSWVEQIAVAVCVSCLAWMAYTLHDNSKTLAVISSQVQEMRGDRVRADDDKTANSERFKKLEDRVTKLEFITGRKNHEY